ncbi:MAG: ATP-grasp domain-containing protein [Bacteroidales bacterium]|jgi:carbamoyl-phosphate synthase large subunit|nr:ATP-grasp domain-containing protein [Bacteroidales bacterium]
MEKTRIMIAGIAGASLGTEILKSLNMAGAYEIFGCDISPTAYGLYETGFSKTFIVDETNYIASVIEVCSESGSDWIIPGGEIPMVLLSSHQEELAKNGITVIGNDKCIIDLFSNKAKTFERLKTIGCEIPRTAPGNSKDNIIEVGLPCIIKPSIGSGGSVMVFFASDIEEAWGYCQFIINSGKTPIVQEYIPALNGEFTVGVLSFSDGEISGSIAMKRNLDAKLSVVQKRGDIVISGGYSQGYIGDFEYIRKQCEEIARAVGSCGPLNIQGRIKNGNFIPFEINPRFSASTYLRALAGFNEVDIFMRYLVKNEKNYFKSPRKGWYLRSFQERFVDNLHQRKESL